ncbi:MAG: murein biosynthesis integral membrane protein MurJ [Spirochaetia bacterium]|nr:murein biosynthesis integral membrane protein MurJ [Spirochaetia bacterium]
MSETARSSIKLSILTVGSRVLGLVRDHYQAVFFGTGAISAAWEIAFMLPNMLRNLLAEGVLSQSFIPIYSLALKGGEEEARRVAGVIMSFLFFLLLFLVIAGIAFFPILLPLYTGRTGSDAELLVYLSQVMFGFIMTASLTAVLAGMSNTHGYFTVPALSPILLNIIYIVSFLALDPMGLGAERNARILAWSVLGGGVVQLGVQALFVKKHGHFPALTLSFQDPALKQIFSLMAPAVLGASMFHLNQLMDIALASYMIPEDRGAVPGLRYAHRLIQLPTGIIGVALSTAILPALVGAIRKNELHKNGQELVGALSFCLFLTVPAGLGLFFLGTPIINLLFFGGAWDARSTAMTWDALRFYTLGVPLYSINKILTSSFFAYQDTRTPIRVMMTIVPINFVLNVVLIQFLFQGGLALSTSISAFLTASVLLLKLSKRMEIPYAAFALSVVRQIPLWAGLGIFLLLLEGPAAAWLDNWGHLISHKSHLSARYVGLIHVVAGGVVGGILYLSAGHFLRLPEMAVLTGFVQRRRRNA